MYSENLTNCRNCFGCSNLTNKSYYIGNKPVEKEEYQDLVNGYLSDIEKLKTFLEKQDMSKFYKSIQ